MEKPHRASVGHADLPAQTEPWTSSGNAMITCSAVVTAALKLTGLKPSASAWLWVRSEPPTVTVAPASRKFNAWALP